MKCPTKEQIKKAAATSPEAKKALVELFPEYFEDEKYFNLAPLTKSDYDCFETRLLEKVGMKGNDFQIRASGPYNNKGFFLNPARINWVIVKESAASWVLLPTKKVIK
jgi:hypothetical protein